MANMLLASPVISDAATLITSATAGELTKANLQTMPIGEVCRFTAPSAVYIQAELSDEINLVALLGHNGSPTGYARVRAADDLADILTTPDYDSGNLPLRSNQSDYSGSDTGGALTKNSFFHYVPNGLNYNYVRVDVSDSALSYFDVGRLYLSKAWQPETNMDYGVADGFIDPSNISRTVSGRQNPLRRPSYRFAEFKLSFGSEDEMYVNAFDLDQLRGETKDVLFINDPDNKPLIQKRSIYGTMRSLSPIVNAYFRLFEKSYRIEEIIE